MIYVDSSIVLSELLDALRAPPSTFWLNKLTASRLTYYEVWTRLHAHGRGPSHGDDATALMQRVIFVDMLPPVLERALSPFPVPLRTLDALHLATMVFLIGEGNPVELASYDNRLIAAARALRIPISEAALPLP